MEIVSVFFYFLETLVVKGLRSPILVHITHYRIDHCSLSNLFLFDKSNCSLPNTKTYELYRIILFCALPALTLLKDLIVLFENTFIIYFIES